MPGPLREPGFVVLVGRAVRPTGLGALAADGGEGGEAAAFASG